MNCSGELFDRRVLAAMELRRDLLFQRIPRGGLREYVELSLAMGREQAERFRGRTLKELCREKDIRIRVQDKTQGMAGMTFRAHITYQDGGAEFTLFRPAMTDMMRIVNNYLLPEQPFSVDDAGDLLIAHEFYHYLEFSELGDTAGRTPPVELPKLWPGKPRYARITRCGEVAAYAFAEGLLQLPFFPNLIDYLYYVETKKWTEQMLLEHLQHAAALLDG